jgi:hypothetical protein
MGMIFQGRPITRAKLTVPAWGAWFLEVEIDQSITARGEVEVSFADLTLEGYVLEGGPATSRSAFRIVGGRGNWRNTLPARSYSDDALVRVSTVVRDAATESAESLDLSTLPTTSVGAAWTRPRGPASRVLDLVAPESWRVDYDGKTRLGRRASSELPVGVTIVDRDLAAGTFELASESLAGLLPGLVIDGLEIVDLEHTLEGTTLRTKAWARRRNGLSRRLAALAALLDRLDPSRRFRGVYEFRVVTQEGKRLNLQPVRVSSGMPDLRRVSVWSAPGVDADVELGSRVLVGFVDGSPALPYVAAFEGADGEGFVPTLLRLADGTAFAARTGDAVSVTVNIPALVIPGVGSTTPASVGASGTITSGSSKVKIG